MEKLEQAKNLLDAHGFSPREATVAGIRVSEDGVRRTAFQLLAFPDVTFEDLIRLDSSLSNIDTETRRQIERDALYANYINRQAKDVEAMRRDEAHAIPEDFEYDSLGGLSNELRQKLRAARPETLGQAARVEGMTPAAISLILARLRQTDRRKSA